MNTIANNVTALDNNSGLTKMAIRKAVEARLLRMRKKGADEKVNISGPAYGLVRAIDDWARRDFKSFNGAGRAEVKLVLLETLALIEELDSTKQD
jgi:hypothetical protein